MSEQYEELVTAHELQHTGGKWLAAAREYLKWHVNGGDQCTWGSAEQLPITVKQIEELAAHVASAAINEERRTFFTDIATGWGTDDD